MSEFTRDVRGAEAPRRNGVGGMLMSAFKDMGARFRDGAVGVVENPAVQEAGTQIIKEETMKFVSVTLPDELRAGTEEAEGLGSTYQMIRDRISTPKDGAILRIFKSFISRGLTMGVRLSSMVSGSILANYTDENEEEKKRYPHYFERMFALLIGRGFYTGQ